MQIEKNNFINHTFAICAYKESPYLQECIDSLKSQTIKSNIIICTSTPCDYISTIADKNEIPLFVNEGEKGITQDWNFAYKMTKTDFVTIAHQDDLYEKEYAEKVLSYAEKSSSPVIVFTDYSELRGSAELGFSVVSSNKLLRIKRALLKPLRNSSNWHKKYSKWHALAFGSAICCPSVTFYKPNCPEEVFVHHFRSDEDWEAWEKLRHIKGDFVYIPCRLMQHRIHEDSETSKIIADNMRSVEDYQMFCKFWPKLIANILTKIYFLSEKSNDIK